MTGTTLTARLGDFGGLVDWDRVQAWIDAHPATPGSGPITEVARIEGGSQNNLFLVTRGGEKFVMRRPPKHPRANSNETMLREARLLKALRGTGVPHADLYAVCDDTSVIGATFYLMRPLAGFAPGGSRALPGRYGSEQCWRYAIGEELVRAAVMLEAVDHIAAGLADYGHPENWHARQVDRWRAQLESYRGAPGYEGPDALSKVDVIGRWLSDNVPKDGRIGIIHGDYQFPNIMFSLEEPEITGLIDWELSTLGDPLLDLGWILTSWWETGDPKQPNIQPWEGFMTRRELVKLYGELSGRDMSAAPWFFVLACYKLGCILEGSYARSKAGQTTKETGQRTRNYAIYLFTKAMQIIKTERI